MPHSNVNKRFSRYPNKEASRSLYTKRFLSRRTSSRHCCPSSTPTSSSPFYREDLRIDSPLRARSWSRETSRRRYRIRGMQVRKMCREREKKKERDVWIFSNFPSGDSLVSRESWPSSLFLVEPLDRNPAESIGSAIKARVVGAGIASQADRAFLRAISVEKNLNESRNCEPISCIPSISIIRVEVRKDVYSLVWRITRWGIFATNR